jgi:Transglycosylase SLT domain
MNRKILFAIGIAFVIVLLSISTIGGTIAVFCFLFRVPIWIVHGIVLTESNRDPNAQGMAGERGLMQLTRDALVDANTVIPFTSYNFDEMYEPTKNLIAGIAYLRWLRDRCENWDIAIQAYNVGLVAAKGGGGSVYLQLVKKHSTEW